MRVPTLQTARSQLEILSQRQAQQARLQEQVSSGLRILTPSDDPVAAAQAEAARSRLARVAQDQRDVQLATGVLSAADGALGQGLDLLQSAREALVAAGNGGYSASDRQALALRLRAVRDELVGLANTPDGAGGFVFAGQGASEAPFGAGGTSYSGDPGTQRIGALGRFAATVDGRAAFMQLPQGNGVFVTASATGNTGSGWIDAGSVSAPAQLTGHAYEIVVGGSAAAPTYSVTDTGTGATMAGGPFAAGSAIDVQGQRVTISGTPAQGDRFTLAPADQRRSVFDTLGDAIGLLEDEGLAPGAYAEGLERAQTGLDRGLDALSLARTRTGEELRRVQDGDAAAQQQEIDATARRSDLQDVDLARAISQLQSGQTGIDAALKTYAALARKSLFDLLS